MTHVTMFDNFFVSCFLLGTFRNFEKRIPRYLDRDVAKLRTFDGLCDNDDDDDGDVGDGDDVDEDGGDNDGGDDGDVIIMMMMMMMTSFFFQIHNSSLAFPSGLDQHVAKNEAFLCDAWLKSLEELVDDDGPLSYGGPYKSRLWAL